MIIAAITNIVIIIGMFFLDTVMQILVYCC